MGRHRERSEAIHTAAKPFAHNSKRADLDGQIDVSFAEGSSKPARVLDKMGEFLIYGATGYTGQLATEHAVRVGLRPVVGGRNAKMLAQMAKGPELEWRCFSLDDAAATRDGITGMAAVLHAAGPFSTTSRSMADACIRAGVHYCDITGEIDVFETLAARDEDARSAGIMLLPGAGFDVVPSDCLAAHLATRMPDATRLRLSIGGLTTLSRGTAKTMAESVAKGTRLRREDHLIETQETPRATMDFGAGSCATIGVSWGDVSTAWHSTHIPNIEVFFQTVPELERASRMPRFLKQLLATRIAQRLIKSQIEARLPPGPSIAERAAGRAVLIGETWNTAGEHMTTRLETPEAYDLTAKTSVEIARLAACGHAVIGYQTPSTAYGADFITKFENVTRLDRPTA